MNVSSTPRFQKGKYFIHWMNLGMSARENDKKTLQKYLVSSIRKLYLLKIYQPKSNYLNNLIYFYFQIQLIDFY